VGEIGSTEILGLAGSFDPSISLRDAPGQKIPVHAAVNLQPSRAVNRFWSHVRHPMTHCCSTFGATAHV